MILYVIPIFFLVRSYKVRYKGSEEGARPEEYIIPAEPDTDTTTYAFKVLYVQEVVTLQKKIFYIFASENEVYTSY